MSYLAKWVLYPPHEKVIDSSWVTFNPPLVSPCQDIAIYGFITNSSPQGCYPSDHPNYSSALRQVVDNAIPRPFETDAWFCPEWGSRVNGTLAASVYLQIERFFLVFGDYVSNRTGVKLYNWEIRECCCRYFD